MKNNFEKLIQNIEKDSFSHGSIPFWSWNDHLEEEELRRQIRDMKGFGMRGFFMHARGGLETEYMSDEWFDAIRVCIDEAKKQGMEAWSYDENGWPSGFGGGELLQDPANHACGLVCETVADFPSPDGDILGIYLVSQDGVVRVDAPVDTTEYTVIRRKKDFSYVDTMNPAVTQKFIQVTHVRYQKELGEAFGTDMPGFFTDEPQYFRYGTPWSDTFHETFEQTFGYSVLDALPAMFKDFKGAEELRYDYYLHCHRSFYDGFIKPLYEWCDQHNVQLTGHAIEEWELSAQMNCCGGIMPFYLYEHIPGIDYLGRGVKNVSGARQLGSVCEQTGKKVALTETFAACGWDVTPSELKQIAELQFAGGANLICEHLYAYSARGQRKRDFPHHFSEHSPWHDHFKPFEMHFQRLGAALSQGKEQADVLVIHPIHSAYLHYIKELREKSILNLETKFSAFVEQFSNDQIPYHFGDETILKELGSVEGDRIRVGQCTYSCVVIPTCETLDSNTVALLREYLNNGGKLYLWDEKPTRVDGRIADLEFLKSNVTYDEVRALSGIFVSSDGAGVPLHMQVRITEQGRLIFLANTSHNSYDNVEIRVASCTGLAALCPETLEIHPLRGRKNADGSVTVLVDFADSESYLLVEGDETYLPYEKTVRRKSIQLPDVFQLAEAPENAILLDQAQISLNGGEFTELRPWARIRDNLFAERFEGTLSLRFPFTVADLPSKLLLVAEPIKNMRVTVNGTTVVLSNAHWRIDRSFLGTDIASLTRIGENEITVTFDYYQREDVYRVLYGGGNEALRNCLAFDTEVEPVYLFGNFRVYSESEWVADKHQTFRTNGKFVLTKAKNTVDLKNFNQDGFAFFAGTIKASTEIQYHAGDPTELILGGRFATCGVEINGTNLGIQIFSDRFDLAPYLKEGNNQLTLTLCFSNRNLLGPHHTQSAEPYFVVPRSFSFEKEWHGDECEIFKPNYSFVKWGIGF